MSNAVPPCTCSAPSKNSVYRMILCGAVSLTLSDRTSVGNEDRDKVSRYQLHKLLDHMATKRSELGFYKAIVSITLLCFLHEPL
jgi:hypothetical protein